MNSSEIKTCIKCKTAFQINERESAIFKNADIPLAEECSICIWKNLLAFWVFGKFCKTTSALSGKTIITNLPNVRQFPLYTYEEWIGDNWNPLSYGEHHDETRPFLIQLKELQDKVPHPHQSGVKNVNCEWNDDVWNSKNCYLCRSLLDCEEVYYGYRMFRCKNSIDLVFCFDTELSYDCTYCFNCYKVRHALDARNCIESAFLYDCRNCTNCFMCWNLRNKEYYIRNIQYPKETYAEKIKLINTGSRKIVEQLKKELQEHIQKDALHRADSNTKTIHSTGNYLEECNHCTNCYFLQKSENAHSCIRGLECRDVVYEVGSLGEKMVYSAVDGYNYDTITTSHSGYCRYSAYLDYCLECEYCFGCVSLQKKKYCILNKQYTEIEYKALIQKIKQNMKKEGSWGKFFPMNFAYCGYENSIAQAYFPETQNKIEAQGGYWENEKEHHECEGVHETEMPDTTKELEKDFSQKAVICPKTKRRFNIAPRELLFYKDHDIPPPIHHPDWRTLERFKPLTSITPHENVCTRCQKEITHFYKSEWNYANILCLDCYHEEVS